MKGENKALSSSIQRVDRQLNLFAITVKCGREILTESRALYFTQRLFSLAILICPRVLEIVEMGHNRGAISGPRDPFSGVIAKALQRPDGTIFHSDDLFKEAIFRGNFHHLKLSFNLAQIVVMSEKILGNARAYPEVISNFGIANEEP
jgi:hypothetical protein